MFNTNQFNNSIKINAVSGTLVKNYKESFIVRFHSGSQMANDLLAADPSIKKNNRQISVVVLQVMLVGDNYMMAEVMYKKDFDDMFEQPSEMEH